MKFAQRLLDKVNGKTKALKDRNEKIKGLNASLSQQYQNSLMEIELHLQKTVDALEIIGLKKAIAEVQHSKSKVAHIIEAILQCLDSNPSLLETILSKPSDHFSYFVMLNYEPLHLLTALYLHKNLNIKESLLKLISNPNIDYRFEAYGVVPVVEILEMEPELRNAMLDRILQDVVAAIQSNNFEKARILIDLDPDHFCKVVVPASGGKTILFFAVENLVANNFFEKQKLDFVNILINDYGFDIDAQDSSGVSCKELVIRQIDNYNDLSCRQGFDGIYFPVLVSSYNRATYLSSFSTAKLNELLKELKVLSCMPDNKLSTTDINLIGLSNLRESGNGMQYHCYNANISENMTVFLARYVFPRITSLSLINCSFNNEALTKIWAAIKNNINIKQITVAIDDANIASLRQVVNSRGLTSLCLIAQKVELGFVAVLADLLDAGCKNLAECEIQIDKAELVADVYLKIVKHNHNLTQSDYSLNISQNFDISFYQGMLAILRGSDKLGRVIMSGITVNTDIARIVLDIIKSCGNIKEVKIQNCTFDEAAKPIIVTIKQLDRIPHRILQGCQIENIEIFECNPENLPADIVAIKDPSLYMQRLQEYRSNLAKEQARVHIIEMRAKMHTAIDSVLRQDFAALQTRDKYDHVYEDLLSPEDIEMINDHVDCVVASSLFDPTVSEALCNLDKLLRLKLAEIRQGFFVAYRYELQKNRLNNWYGSVADLNIVARIFGCKILLHTDYVDSVDLVSKSRVLEFGSAVYASEIHLVRQGNIYFGYSSQYHTLIPNTGDDLNLFRACIHAFIDQSCPAEQIIAVSDKYVAELRYATAVCMERADDLCIKAHDTFISELIAAQNRDVAYQFAKNLPQHNLKIVAELIQHKRILDAIQKITARANILKISDVTDDVKSRINQLLHNQRNVETLFCTNRDMRADNANSIEVKDVDQIALNNYFQESANVLIQRQEERQAMFQDKLSTAFDELAKIEVIRQAMIAALQEQIEQLRLNAVADIDDNYRRTRKAFKKALIKAGVGVALSLVCLEIFAAPLAQLLFSSSLISNATFAKLAAEAIISSLVSNLTSGGKLKRLPEEISKAFLISAAGSFATSSLSKGYSLQNLPRNIAHSKLIVTTQMTIESSVRAALNKKNISDEALATGIAATLLGCAVGIDATDKNMKLVFDPSLTALKEIVKGSNSDTIAMEIALQVVQSLATLGMIKAMDTVKSMPNTKPVPPQAFPPRTYAAGDAIDKDLTYGNADTIDDDTDSTHKNSMFGPDGDDYFDFLNPVSDTIALDASIAIFMQDRASLYPMSIRSASWSDDAKFVVGATLGVGRTLLSPIEDMVYARSPINNVFFMLQRPEYTPNEHDISILMPSMSGLAKIWYVYKKNFNLSIQQGNEYLRTGNHFKAGYTRGHADSGVVLDAASLMLLGYGSYRATSRVASLSKSFVNSHEFRIPVTFSFEPGKLYNGPPIDAVKFRNPVVKRPESKSGRNYAPTTKHEPGTIYSLNIIPDAEAGQILLDTAYTHPSTKQVYNVYNGKLIKFQPDNTGGWHAYVVKPGGSIPVLTQVPHEILKRMLSNKLITKKQYRQFIKNKE